MSCGDCEELEVVFPPVDVVRVTELMEQYRGHPLELQRRQNVVAHPSAVLEDAKTRGSRAPRRVDDVSDYF